MKRLPKDLNRQIYSSTFNGLPVQTGDIICTRDGLSGSLFGYIWRLFGRATPGEVDHCLIYLGPGGRCVESGPKGVLVFDMPGEIWNAPALAARRLILDHFVGVAYPLAGMGLEPACEAEIRRAVAAFCLEKTEHWRPYNPNYLNPETDAAYYCSQLVYCAYLPHGINLNTNQGVPQGTLFDRIVFPQEVWNACPHRRPAAEAAEAWSPEAD